MRKSLGLIALAIVVLMTMVSLFIGCSNEIDGSLTGSLTVRTSSANARTISPTPAEIGIVSYKVNGVYSDTITAFPEVTSSSNDITVENLLVGDWTITLDGLNENGVVIATKTQVVTIYERQNTEATFYLELFSGTGTVSIEIQWPSSVTSFTQIKGTITPAVTGKEGFLVAASTATPLEGDFKSINQVINEFPTGSYQFKLEFLDAADNSVGLTYREALNVYKNMTSSKAYSVPEAIFPIETPTITMDESFQVSISCATSGVKIFYTTDGSDSTISDAEFSTAFSISQNTTVKAIAVREDRLSSAVGEAFLEVPAAAPTFSLDAGTYDSPRTITLISATNGATIYYSLDGMITSTEYSKAIPINENTVVTAYAVHPNHSNSSVSSAAYKIQAGKPTFSLKEGSYSGAQTLDLFSATDGSTIYYTTDGLAPTTGSQVFGSSISLNTTTTVRAYAVKENMEPSAVSQSIYTIDAYEVGGIGPSGGYVFYDDEIGYDLDSDGTIEEVEKNLLVEGKRYLEAAPSDLLLGDSDYSHIFGYYRTISNGALVLIGTATGIGTGQANTTALVAAMDSTAYISSTTSITTTTADYAARMCDIHEAGGYSDWFLPSKDELYLMLQNLKVNNLGGFSGDYYWSSSESNANFAWTQDFNDGIQYYYSYRYDDFRVRPVRAF